LIEGVCWNWAISAHSTTSVSKRCAGYMSAAAVTASLHVFVTSYVLLRQTRLSFARTDPRSDTVYFNTNTSRVAPGYHSRLSGIFSLGRHRRHRTHRISTLGAYSITRSPRILRHRWDPPRVLHRIQRQLRTFTVSRHSRRSRCAHGGRDAETA